MKQTYDKWTKEKQLLVGHCTFLFNPICQHQEQKREREREITQNNAWDIWVVVGDRGCSGGLVYSFRSSAKNERMLLKYQSKARPLCIFTHYSGHLWTFELHCVTKLALVPALWTPSASGPAGVIPLSGGCQPGHGFKTSSQGILLWLAHSSSGLSDVLILCSCLDLWHLWEKLANHCKCNLKAGHLKDNSTLFFIK